MKKICRAFLLLTVLCISLFGSGCEQQSSSADVSKEIYAPKVSSESDEDKVVEAKVGTISEKYYHEADYVNPYTEAITFETDGIVSSVDIEDGQEVKKGEILAHLNTDEIDKRIEEQKLRLNSAKKTLSKLKNNKKADKYEKESAEYDVQIEQNAYDSLMFEYEKYTVKAPCKGEVSIQISEDETEIKKGSHISAGQLLCNMQAADSEKLCMMVYDDEKFLDVDFGMNCTLTQGDVTETGKVTDIVFQARGGDYDAYYYVITPDRKNSKLVRGGETINASIDVYTKEDVVTVPTDAIKTVDGNDYVDVLVDGMKIQTDVEIGIQGDTETEIISGLSGGEQIILPNITEE